jgi:hypothetical protein
VKRHLTWLALVFGITSQASADSYSITFTDGGANVGSGQIDVVGSFAVSGFFDVTSGAASGYLWTLTGGTTSYPDFLLSPLGAFNYNNAVYLTTNPEYPTTDPFLDNYGLLFTDNVGDEINLWGNADGSYSFYGDINGARYAPAVVSGSGTISPVPEPSSCALAIFGLILVGGSAGRFYIGRRSSTGAG